MAKHIGILTSGGDCPGLNAAIRALGKAGQDRFGMHFLGFHDGFRGLAFDRTMPLESSMLSGILTDGGTILGTSRDKPHRMIVGGKLQNMIPAIVDTYDRHHLDGLVCLGGGGTLKNALRLKKAGLKVITLPKTIDNDIVGTDVTFGFDTALSTAMEAIDRLHSTATSHHRIIVVEIMGHRAGWLALGAGVAGGADVILIPEIPYSIQRVSQAIRDRTRAGKRFSIVAIAEGAMTREHLQQVNNLVESKKMTASKREKARYSQQLHRFHQAHVDHTLHLSERLAVLTGLESRLTILGHLLRGGPPSAVDRVLATRLGTACAELLNQEVSGVMIALRGESIEAVPLEAIAGKTKFVPLDHPWVKSARFVGTSFGDDLHASAILQKAAESA